MRARQSSQTVLLQSVSFILSCNLRVCLADVCPCIDALAVGVSTLTCHFASCAVSVALHCLVGATNVTEGQGVR